MLTVTDVLTLLAEGRPLPQQELPVVTDQQIGVLQDAEPRVLNLALSDVDDPTDPILSALRELAAENGWYATCSMLCLLFGHRYNENSVPALETVSDETMGLLKMLPIAARAMNGDERAWTIPFAMLASLGEEGALEFTTCAALCAAIGHVQSSLERGVGK